MAAKDKKEKELEVTNEAEATEKVEAEKVDEPKTIQVKVKGTPVLHNNEDLEPGGTYEIEEKYFNEELFEKIEE